MIVFPMAGESSRFRQDGFEAPKFMLPIAGATCFDLAICSIVSGLPEAPIILAARRSPELVEFIAARLRALNLKRARLVELDVPTRGQAETVERAIAGEGTDDAEGLVIFNIDTFRRNFALPAVSDRGDAYLETFTASGDHWSFVEDDGSGTRRVLRTAEKHRISDHCCTGLYQFARLDDFRSALAVERASPSAGELYVAPLYNHLIRRGRDVRYGIVPASEVALAGMPAEYRSVRDAWGAHRVVIGRDAAAGPFAVVEAAWGAPLPGDVAQPDAGGPVPTLAGRRHR